MAKTENVLLSGWRQILIRNKCKTQHNRKWVLWRKVKQGAGLRSTGQRLWISVRLSEAFLRRRHLGRGLKELESGELLWQKELKEE